MPAAIILSFRQAKNSRTACQHNQEAVLKLALLATHVAVFHRLQVWCFRMSSFLTDLVDIGIRRHFLSIESLAALAHSSLQAHTLFYKMVTSNH